jgi:hypothetical protein
MNRSRPHWLVLAAACFAAACYSQSRGFNVAPMTGGVAPDNHECSRTPYVQRMGDHNINVQLVGESRNISSGAGPYRVEVVVRTSAPDARTARFDSAVVVTDEGWSYRLSTRDSVPTSAPFNESSSPEHSASERCEARPIRGISILRSASSVPLDYRKGRVVHVRVYIAIEVAGGTHAGQLDFMFVASFELLPFNIV